MRCLYIATYSYRYPYQEYLYLASGVSSTRNAPWLVDNLLCDREHAFLKPETGVAYLSVAIRPEIHSERDHVVDRRIGGLV